MMSGAGREAVPGKKRQRERREEIFPLVLPCGEERGEKCGRLPRDSPLPTPKGKKNTRKYHYLLFLFWKKSNPRTRLFILSSAKKESAERKRERSGICPIYPSFIKEKKKEGRELTSFLYSLLKEKRKTRGEWNNDEPSLHLCPTLGEEKRPPQPFSSRIQEQRSRKK